MIRIEEGVAIMLAEAELRLAWQAAREGRAGARDLLLTLAVADASPRDTWAEPCRRLLVRRRPGHLFAAFPDRGRALADPGVVEGLAKARRIYPAPRVKWQLVRSEALRGPFTGRLLPLSVVLDDLFRSPPDPPEPRRRSVPNRPKLGTVGTAGRVPAASGAVATARVDAAPIDPVIPALLVLLTAALAIVAESSAATPSGETRAA